MTGACVRVCVYARTLVHVHMRTRGSCLLLSVFLLTVTGSGKNFL